ncbi:Uma2 family endonuclease [Actinomadura craniellae]|uniref:Uma2 family endonuclease n=1 Tax=Actinomadura craniellae TaxID=2231787 RepID=A0A365HBK7_9ACTN|nr:Uma2 family endonuclease [Actinomadura craniellae]RAY16402.1 Uma2 family endonuclease [Actinomadura craniellae]
MDGGEGGMAMPLPAEPSHGGYTVEDWMNLPESVGQRVELIDGSFVVSPTPLSIHQICAKRLVRILDDAAPGDMEVVEAFGVRTADEVPVPDVLVGDAEVLLGAAAVLQPGEVYAVAEIVSMGNRRRDYQDKPRLYAEAGIGTFLRIELAGPNPPHVEVLALRDGKYVSVVNAAAGETVALTEPFPVRFDPAELVGRRRR